MDALSHILEDIPISQAEYVYISGRGNWLIEQPQQSAMVIYAVTAGEAYLYLHDKSIKLEAGGILLMPSGVRHQTGFPDSKHSLSTPYLATPDRLTFGGHDNPLQYTGEGNTHAVVLAVRCLIDAEMSRPILSALPDCFLLHGENNQSMPAWLQLGLQFLGLET
ncbi:MAG: cupin domain-containing protein, partial [Candidatus Saccharibacteria bacterium]|nr:cupin domain-containing protein [Moraxellaceae bacterium]